MAPIDPNQLLKAFEPWLTIDGGIKNKEEVPRLTSLMKKYSKKLVSRCVYINVLQHTSPEVLESFLETDGWKTLNEWLKDAKESGNHEFLKELLSLIGKCPVNLNRLKENDTPRVVKGLSKSGQDEEIVDLATTVVGSWTDLIGKTAEVTADTPKTSKVSKKRSKSGDNVDTKAAAAGGGDEVVNKKAKRLDSVTSDDGSNVSDGNNAMSVDSNSNSLDATATEPSLSVVDALTSKPSTVVMKPGKSNLDGLIKQNTTTPSTSSSSSTTASSSADNNSLITAKDGKLDDKNKKSGSSTKTQQQQLTQTINKEVSKDGGGDKKESKDTDNGTTPVPIKRSNSSDKSSTPPPKVVSIKESDVFASILSVEPILTSKSKGIKRKSITRQTKVDIVNDNDDSNQQLTNSASNNNNNSRRTSSSSDQGTSEGINTSINQDTEAQVNKLAKIGNSNIISQLNTTCPTPQGPSKSFPRGCLLMRTSSEKKKVRFLPDPWIQAVKLFEVEADERVNMYRINSLAALSERRGEAAALKNHVTDETESGSNLAPWVLIAVDVPSTTTIRGKNSVEKDVQEVRHRQVLASIFMNKHQTPDSPSEPDRCELIAMTAAASANCIEIPTSDLAGTVNDYSGSIQPEPKSNAMYGSPGFVASNCNNYQLDPLIAVAQSLQQSQVMSTMSNIPSSSSSSSYPSFSSTYNAGQVASTYNPRVVDYGNHGNNNANDVFRGQRGGGGQRGNGTTRGGHNDRRSSIICKDFLQGKCRYPNCKYSHDTQRSRSMNNINYGQGQRSNNTNNEIDWGS